MRVYEFSKQHNLTNKQVLAILQEAGIDVSNHMSVLTPEALQVLEKKMKPERPVVNVEKKAPEPIEEKKVVVEKATEKEITKPEIKEPQIMKQPQSAPKFFHNKPQQASTGRDNRSYNYQQQKSQPEPIVPVDVTISVEPMMLSDLAHKLNKPVTDLILALLKWKVLSNKNYLLSEELVTKIADMYGAKTVKPVIERKEETRKVIAAVDGAVERSPIVVVLGHVDHGKTTLLDFIRKTRVAAREKGGITQHLGAYQATTPQGNLVFLDTPGHEAFSKIRSRGLKVADIAVLVVAADDGVMPQTIEAIKTAKSMKVPVVVAINKVDKVEPSRIDNVKRDVAQHDLLPEEWGGDVVYVPISAKAGTNIDQLLEIIVLQSQLMELKAAINIPAQGFVLESKLEKGRGPVATVITQQGTIKLGDYFISGTIGGKVSSLVDSTGARITQAGPSVPVQVAGFDQMPQAGDYFECVTKEAYQKRVQRNPVEEQKIAIAKAQSTQGSINIILKTDNNSSKEALNDSIVKMSKKLEKGFNIVAASVGSVSESDIEFASNTNSEIYTLHVKPDANSALFAQRLGVKISVYDIIYKLLEALQARADKEKVVKMIRKKTGEAVVRKVFDIKDIGVIAGCYVREGIFTRDGNVVIWRGNRKIGQGKIKTLQRDRKTVKDVHTGFECAFLVEGHTDWAEDDRVECFIEVPEQPKN